MLRCILVNIMLFMFANLLLSQNNNTLSSQDSLIIADTTDLTITSLGVPSTPAFLMLGIEPSSIEKPKDPKAFLFSIANATQNFSALPKTFAMEVSPFMLARKENVDLSSYLSNKNPLNNIAQTFTISIATNTIDSVPNISPITTELGVAAKFSIWRGKVKDSTLLQLASIDNNLARLNSISYNNVNTFLNSSSEYKAFEDKFKAGTLTTEDASKFTALGDSLTKVFNQEKQMIKDSIPIYNQLLAEIKTKGADLNLERVGFKLDAAFGVVYDFPFQNVDSVNFARLGAWLTGGWNKKGKGENPWTRNLLFSARLLKNMNQMMVMDNGMTSTNDNLYFDIGGKVELTKGSKISLSFEGLRRFILNNDEIDPTYRVAFNGNYQVSSDYNLSLTFGRNFNGTIAQGGNLLAALHLFGIFGNRKSQTELSQIKAIQ